MNNVEIAIGEKIKSLRKKREITQEQLAVYLNISFQSVSKWECGDAYPDITMLPKIAMFFGVTTDELLCIDNLKEQEEINEYRKRYHEALATGHTKEAVDVMRVANAKYPGNFRIMYELAYALQTDADVKHLQQNRKEIITIGEKILAECKDNITRTGIIEVMCNAYVCLGEKEKAKKLINENLSSLWVSQETMLVRVLEGDELTKHRQRTLLTLTELHSWEMWYLSENFACEDRLVVLENIIKIYSMVFTDGNYGYYHVKVKGFHIGAMNICIDIGNNLKFLDHLKSAADHSIAFDNDYIDHFKLYTAPLINKAYYGGLIKSYKGNESYNLLKKLDDEKYNVINKMPEFIRICDELKIHAKEDN
ncbi:MAG: helix-turn-helix transcriptional regulator [Eubacteriales bacterium]|nr:helix-turn-helix transcriptional regulator [Eubacteriales bacterium]